MDSHKTFTLTKEHVKLLRAAYVGWEDCEFGAPAIDCKRPYGNSSVAEDIAEILGWTVDYDDDDEMPDEVHGRATKVHQETETALQVVLSTGSFEPGTYRAPRYGGTWERDDDRDEG